MSRNAATVIPFDRNQTNDLPDPRNGEVEVVPVRKNLRDAIEDVFYELGGIEGMAAWAKENTANRRIFYKDIIPKLIPKEIVGEFTGANKGPIKMVVEWEGSTPDPTEAQIINAPARMIMEAVTSSVLDEE